MEVSLKTQPQKILTLKCTGMCTLLLAFAVFGAPGFFGCMHEAARQAELNQESGGEDALAADFGQSAELAGYGGSDSWIENLGPSLGGEGDLGPDPAAANAGSSAGPSSETGGYDEPDSATADGDYADEEADPEVANPIAVSSADELDISSAQPAVVCVTTSTSWRNFAFSAQTGVFTATFSVVPATRSMDGVIALAGRTVGGYADAAVSIRFGPNGRIAARNGDAYLSETQISYAANQVLSFRLEVDAAARRYDAYVTPRGGAEAVLASGYAYRTEQASCSVLDHWACISAIGTMQVCDFQLQGTPPPPGCETTTSGWQNFPIDSQTGRFTATFAATPAAAGMDGVIALAPNEVTGYGNCAVLVRFAPNGRIDARNGGTYSAVTAIPYTPNAEYLFRLEVDAAAKRYDAYVTTPSGSTAVLASGYAYRSEQSGCSALNNWACISAVGAIEVCDFAIDSDGPQPPPPPPPPDCAVATTSWQNFPMENQTGAFTVTYTATPSAAGMDGVVALALNDVSSYSNGAVQIRFAPNGRIDARNGSAYEATTNIPYTPGAEYLIRVAVYLPTHTYSAYVTPPGGNELLLASNYGFRTEQAGVAALNRWACIAAVGGIEICDFAVGPAANQPPIANAGPDQTVVDADGSGSQAVTLSGSGSYDPDGSIVSYVWREGATTLASGVSATVNLAVGSHTITLTVTDDDGATATDTVAVSVAPPGGGTTSWTNGGFDIQISGALFSAKWTPYTKDRYVVVAPGANPTVTVIRRSDMRDADGQLRAAGNTRVHVGPLTIGNEQMWTPDWSGYSAQGSFVYSSPFHTGSITAPTPVQIWNQHVGVPFNGSAWLAYGSNALEIWFIPSGMAVGDVPPPDYSNGRIPAGTLVTAPEGTWPALWRNSADRTRLQNAISKFSSQGVAGGSGPFDIRGDGDYYDTLSNWAAKNALLGWRLNSAPHLNAARQQLLALLSVRFYGHEVAAWYRPRCVPSADLLSGYGREQQNVFFNAMIAACALGPNMANALTDEELDAVNAHLYRYAMHDVYASLTNNQYYTADGGINLHYHPIVVTAGWNWNLAEAVNVADTLSNPTHTECSYFISGGVGRYALRYCQLGDAGDTSYENVGNSQSVRFWYRFGEFFNRPTEIPAVDEYVCDQWSGDVFGSISDALGALMDSWNP